MERFRAVRVAGTGKDLAVHASQILGAEGTIIRDLNDTEHSYYRHPAEWSISDNILMKDKGDMQRVQQYGRPKSAYDYHGQQGYQPCCSACR
jgi:hypothetical protein